MANTLVASALLLLCCCSRVVSETERFLEVSPLGRNTQHIRTANEAWAWPDNRLGPWTSKIVGFDESLLDGKQQDMHMLSYLQKKVPYP
jgi:hypothetical protein